VSLDVERSGVLLTKKKNCLIVVMEGGEYGKSARLKVKCVGRKVTEGKFVFLKLYPTKK
jgi:hypothetical protein